MQLNLSSQVFPLVFHCNECNKVAAMIECHTTTDEDSGETIITKGYYRLICFPCSDVSGTQVALDKGTLVECLYALSRMALEHEAFVQTSALLAEILANDETLSFEDDDPLYLNDNQTMH